MSDFTDSLSNFYGETHRATAKIVAVQANGYSALTTSGGDAILLTAPTGGYATNDVVYYDIKTRKILDKAAVSSWINIPV